MGHRNRPAYRVVVVDSRKARDGEHLKSVGHYDLRTKLLNLNTKRIGHWVSECTPAPESGATETAEPGDAERRTQMGAGAQTTESQGPGAGRFPTPVVMFFG